jgi:hypothetical protein
MPNHPQQACWNCRHAVSPIPQFGLTVHVDTTSFAVHGQYASPGAAGEVPAAALTTGADLPPAGEDLPAVIAVTYGYSRDHREDLKQWMQALVTSGGRRAAVPAATGRPRQRPAGAALDGHRPAPAAVTVQANLE